MPELTVHCEILHADQLQHWHFEGELCTANLQLSLKKLGQARDGLSGGENYHRLMDFCGVIIRLDYTSLEYLGRLFSRLYATLPKEVQTVYIADTDLEYGDLRVIASLAEGGREVEVFRSVAAARAWLEDPQE